MSFFGLVYSLSYSLPDHSVRIPGWRRHGSNRMPCRRPGVARGLDKGLDENRGGIVALGLVLGQTSADDGEDVRAEVEDTEGEL